MRIGNIEVLGFISKRKSEEGEKRENREKEILEKYFEETKNPSDACLALSLVSVGGREEKEEECQTGKSSVHTTHLWQTLELSPAQPGRT